MIFSMILLFLLLLSSAAVIYYLYAFFIPALKIKNKEYNDLLATDFGFDNDLERTSGSSIVIFPEKEKKDEIFDSLYRSEINDEKICVSFDENSQAAQEADGAFYNKNLEKSHSNEAKCFKFWIYCYKLLEKRKFAKSGQNQN